MHNQTNEEAFILNILDNKRNGFYVELGGADPSIGNNTYMLEKDYDWKGVTFELNDELRNKFKAERSNPCFGDALDFNYAKYFEENNFPKQIDYLQVDIDSGYDEAGRPCGSAYTSLHGLISIPLTQYRFSVITFEHDANMYWRNIDIRNVQREILDSLGYALVVRTIYEDWWVDPTVFHHEKFRKFYKWDQL
jgi:hypothetical protein